MSVKIVISAVGREKLRKQKMGIVSSLILGLGIMMLMPGKAEALFKTGQAWPTGVIPVCWRSDAFAHTGYHDTNARKIRDIVENNWGRVANIRFVGWEMCPGPPLSEPTGTIVIHWEDDDVNKGPRADIGYYGTKRTFVRLVPIDPNIVDPREKQEEEARFKADALHEFGHALSFDHEMDRPDNPNKNPNLCWGTPKSGDKLATPFDQLSIMTWTYCGNPPGGLSAWDIVGVENLYGRKGTGTIVGLNNRCVDVPSSITTIGTQLQVYNCHGGINQSWARLWDGSLQVTLLGLYFPPGALVANRCADVPGVSPYSGTIVQTHYCLSAPWQKFTFENVEVRGMGNKCLDVPSSNYFPGQNVQLYDCNGTAAQKWTVEPNGRIRAGSSEYCLDVPGGVAASGQLLQLYPCHDGANQKFTFTGYGEIKFGGFCFDSQSAVPDNGKKVQLYQCKPDGRGKRNQQWYLSGPIHGLGGQCLDIRGGVSTDFAKAQLYPCHGGANQTWDYYFR